MSNNKSTIHCLIKNSLSACMAQFISLLASGAMILIIPKIINVNQYSYWQLFIFYSSYVYFFHLGLPDGIYLKLGGVNYVDLDYRRIGSQLKMMSMFHLVVGCVFCILSYIFVDDPSRFFILLLTAIYLVIANIFNYCSMLSQITNRINVYANGIIIDKICFLISIFILIAFDNKGFHLFVVVFIVSRVIAIVYYVFQIKEIFVSKSMPAKYIAIDIFNNIKIGISLTVASIASLLILGVCKLTIDLNWGLEKFGRFSFSFSLANCLLLFMTQFGLVLFPLLKRVTPDKVKTMYALFHDALNIFLMSFFLLYFPICQFVDFWIPQYNSSLIYLIFLIPICVFDGKMQLLFNTYLKVFRKEKMILYLNIIPLAICCFSTFIGVYYFNNIYIVICSTCMSIGIRSIISEIYLGYLMGVEVKFNLLFDLILIGAFVLFTWIDGALIGCAIYFPLLLTYLFFKRKSLHESLNIIRANWKLQSLF